MPLAIRLLALLFVAIVAFVANAYAQQYWAGWLFPRVYPRPYTEMVSAAVVGAVAAAAVSAFPSARLFPKHAWAAGLFVALPVMVVRSPEVGATGTAMQEAISIMAWVEMLSYTTAVVVGAWLASRRPQGPERAL